MLRLLPRILACALVCGSAYAQGESSADRYHEYFQWRMQSERDEFGRVPLDARTIATEQRKALVIGRPRPLAPGITSPESAASPEIAGIAPQRWTALGPGNIGGRVRSLVVHPTNPQKIWVGSVSGGIWTTSDGGASWHPVDDNLPSLSISSLAIDPTNSGVMYAGTGEGDYSNLTSDLISGVGIYKSVDGGVTWSRLPATSPALDPGWQYVARVAVHPTDGNIVLAATKAGIYRSADGGASWALVTAKGTLDVRFNPSDGTKAVAGTGQGSVFLSTDSGASWSEMVLIANGDKVQTAYAASNPNVLYASVAVVNSPFAVRFFKSTNGGASWTLVSSPTLSNSWNDWLWVSPTDPNLIALSAVPLYRSTDGGATFTQITGTVPPQAPHADIHAVVNDPGYNGTTNRRVYITTDGGVYVTNDITTANSGPTTPGNGWINLNNGLQITQFYAGAAKPGGVTLGGTQDNGILVLPAGTTGTNWTPSFPFGDGGFAAADRSDNYLYGEIQGLLLLRSADGGSTWQSICSGITDASFSCGGTQMTSFISPFVLDPNNSSRLLAGANSLWRSNDVKAAMPTWSAIKGPGRIFISALAVAEGNPDIIWAGHGAAAEIYKTTNGTASSPSWTRVSTGLPVRNLTRILIDKSAPNTVYVTFGGYTSGNVWKTTDGGATWTDIHGALPQAPIRTITRHPLMPSWIYVGTEVGVFSSQDGGAHWTTSSDGPGTVSVDELFWRDNATLIAATHGRGMFSSTVLVARVSHDFNADSRSDILWRNSSTGENYVYFMNGTTISGEGFVRTVADQHWQIAGVGDFDGDGKSDILWRNSSTGENYIYLMNGTTIAGEGFIRTVSDQNWQVAGIGDFDGDGKDDILWRNAITGENYVYPMDGLSIKAGEGYLRTVADLNWQVAGIGDFDGDGKADILWRNASTGQNYLYPMDGRTIKPTEGFLRTVADLNWTIAGVGDFDGDGKSDILWRNIANGQNYIYPMNGTAIKPTEGYIRTVADLAWQIVAVGDYDGDGKSDIFWRNSSTGQNYLYPMDGTSIKAGEGFIRMVPVGGWSVVSR